MILPADIRQASRFEFCLPFVQTEASRKNGKLRLCNSQTDCLQATEVSHTMATERRELELEQKSFEGS